MVKKPFVTKYSRPCDLAYSHLSDLNSYHSPFWTLSSIWLPLYSPQTMWMCLMPLCLVLPLYWLPISRFTLRSVHSLVQFSHSVLSDSLKPRGLQHTKLRYSSPTPGTCSNACSLSQWCHPTISSSVVPFSSRFQSFPASGSFPKSQFFTSGGQSIGLSASASVLPMNIKGWLLLGLTSLISLQSKGHSKVFSSITVLKHHLRHSISLWFNSYIFTSLLEKK